MAALRDQTCCRISYTIYQVLSILVLRFHLPDKITIAISLTMTDRTQVSPSFPCGWPPLRIRLPEVWLLPRSLEPPPNLGDRVRLRRTRNHLGCLTFATLPELISFLHSLLIFTSFSSLHNLILPLCNNLLYRFNVACSRLLLHGGLRLILMNHNQITIFCLLVSLNRS